MLDPSKQYIEVDYKMYDKVVRKYDSGLEKGFTDTTPLKDGYGCAVILKEEKESFVKNVEDTGGKIIGISDHIPGTIDCRKCLGGFKHDSENCPDCNGTGRIDSDRGKINKALLKAGLKPLMSTHFWKQKGWDIHTIDFCWCWVGMTVDEVLENLATKTKEEIIKYSDERKAGTCGTPV